MVDNQEPLSAICRCGMIADNEGNIAIIHDEQSDINVEWLEYRADDANSIYIMDDQGNSLPLGIAINQGMIDNIVIGQEISLVGYRNGRIASSITVPFIVQDY